MHSQRIYLATSWRNPHYEDYLKLIRDQGYDVYDFRDPDYAFKWEVLDPKYRTWTVQKYLQNLKTEEAERGFKRDFEAMQWADTIVGLLEAGKSMHLELGWGWGAGKKTIIHFPNKVDVGGNPELMYKGITHITWQVIGLLKALEE